MTEDQLEDQLSAPYPEDIAAAKAWSGPLLILGAGGKMGPSLAKRAARSGAQVIAVSRYSDPAARADLERSGISTVSADLMAPGSIESLPDATHIIYMAARKFGTSDDNAQTWAANAFLPGLVAQRYRNARIVAFSTGNVYPLVPIDTGGCTESTPTAPVGEYAQSALGRERIFEYFSRTAGTPVTLLRLNYAVEPRYGVLSDIARKVYEDQPVDVSMGYVNVIWQGDANSICLRSFDLCQSPPAVLNLTGAEVLRVRDLAAAFGREFGKTPAITGQEAPTALLSNAAHCVHRFGAPRVSLDQVIHWTAEWIRTGGRSLNKPTHFEVRDGRF